MKADPNRPVKRSFSFSGSDKKILHDIVQGLRRAGVPSVRNGTVLRAFAYLNSATEMFSAAVLLDRDLKVGAGSGDRYDPPPLTADLAQADVDKLADVGVELHAKNIASTHSFIMRALLRSAPDMKILVTQMRRFQQEVPRRPRASKKSHARS
ncbi:MAG: hypothetical protein KF715_19690 [Candidatus Didemnitutus sp.]|nr:hypothetical protein [Candidatus Didemnitutus sp.]